MPVLISLLWSLCEFAVGYVLSTLVTDGVITATVSQGAAPQLAEFLFVSILALIVAGLSVWRKWIKGLLPNSPYPPSNLLGIATSPKELNAPVIDPRDLPPAVTIPSPIRAEDLNQK